MTKPKSIEALKVFKVRIAKDSLEHIEVYTKADIESKSSDDIVKDAEKTQPMEKINVTYGIVDPDYARVYSIIRCTAWMHGYAVLMHGSFTRDLDILLVPWEKKPTTDIEHMVDMFCSRCEIERNGLPPTIKFNGRIAYTLLFPKFGDPRFIDISFIPLTDQAMKASE